ncbi:hypothetical protein AUJ62_01830 [Candidatus Pacearchaeota archaeon CG1_02_32_21]|nr:MAG: hypothetical protein AUJ62_01830 [Candidatus Pacearchaeota archaeon CG1_02_32_21]
MKSIKYCTSTVKRFALINDPGVRKKLEREGCFMCTSKIGEFAYQVGIINVANGEAFMASFCEECSKKLESVLSTVLNSGQISFEEFRSLGKIIPYYAIEVSENER